MRVRGDLQPSNAFSIEECPQRPGFCLVRFFENAVPFTETEGELTISGWEYDEYHLELEDTGDLQSDILNNYDAMLAAAIQEEIDNQPALERFNKNEAAIDEQNLVNSIVFVTMAENDMIDEVTAGEHAALFPFWEPAVNYSAGQLRVDPEDGCLYKCLQAHTSQDGWLPHETAALWKKSADPAEEWPDWSQPISAADAYGTGDKVSYGGKRWISDLDGNVWEPGVYGWTEYTE